jgi:hypothetical protein
MGPAPTSALARRAGDRRRPVLRSAMPLALATALGASLVGGLGPPTIAAAQDGAAGLETAALIPDDALAYISVDLRIDNEQWAQTQELLTRIGYPDALPMLRDEILSEAGIVDSDGSVPADDPLFGGEVGVYVGPPVVDRIMEAANEMGAMSGMAGMEGMADDATPGVDEASPVAEGADRAPIGVAAVFLPGDADAAWEAIQDLQVAEGGSEFETSEYEGTEISFQADEFNPEGGTAIARVDDAILVAGTPADLEPIIDVANGDAPAIAELDELGDVQSRLAEESLVFGFVNGRLIGDALPDEVVDALAAQNPQTADLGDAMFDVAAGFVLHADDEGFRLDSINVYPEDSPLLAMQPQNFDVTADERVPADTLVFAAGSVPEQEGVLDSVALSLAQAINMGMGEGGSGEQMTDPFAALDPAYVEEQFAAAEEVLGFDLRTGLFDQLVGEVVFAASLPGFTAGGIDFNAVAAVGVDDEAVVADNLARIARAIDDAAADDESASIDVTTRDLAGDRIFVVRDPEAPEAFAGEFGVVGDELLAGAGTGIDDYVGGPDASLADDARYQEVLATLPAENAAIFYVDLSQIVTLLETTGVVGGDLGATVDADPACADYEDAADAQEAYDADPFDNAALDQDFDGDACEDFFAAATPEAAAPSGSLDALQALASVVYVGDEENVSGSSTILYIGEGEGDS